MTKKFERQLLDEDWQVIREGLEVKMCPSPDGGKETYILCRSRDRREKEKAMHERFECRIDESLEKVRASGEKRKWKKEVEELGKISLVDAVLPTRQKKVEIRRRGVARTNDQQATLLAPSRPEPASSTKSCQPNVVEKSHRPTCKTRGFTEATGQLGLASLTPIR